LGPDRVDIIERAMNTPAADELCSAALQVLREANPSNVDFSSADAPSGSLDSLAARIVNKRAADGKPARMDFIKIKDASLTLGISLVTLSVALMMLSPTAIGPALNGLKGLYDNWVTLKDAKDEDAMTAYDALLRHAAKTVAEPVPGGNYERPVVKADDLPDLGGPPSERCLRALKRLKDVGLAEVVVWGPNGDLDDPENLWSHRA
jgi:hypothetical protein